MLFSSPRSSSSFTWTRFYYKNQVHPFPTNIKSLKYTSAFKRRAQRGPTHTTSFFPSSSVAARHGRGSRR
jgi:hypothetical protein